MMKALIKTGLPLRESDKWGQGYFGAPRGSRTHRGIDYQCPAGAAVLAPVAGMVTKLGYPYGDDLSFRYVQITDSTGIHHRVFYVEPQIWVGQVVKADAPIGMAQDLERRYPGITPHIHYEIKKDGEFINPETEGSV